MRHFQFCFRIKSLRNTVLFQLSEELGLAKSIGLQQTVPPLLFPVTQIARLPVLAVYPHGLLFNVVNWIQLSVSEQRHRTRDLTQKSPKVKMVQETLLTGKFPRPKPSLEKMHVFISLLIVLFTVSSMGAECLLKTASSSVLFKVLVSGQFLKHMLNN